MNQTKSAVSGKPQIPRQVPGRRRDAARNQRRLGVLPERPPRRVRHRVRPRERHEQGRCNSASISRTTTRTSSTSSSFTAVPRRR